eukprot:COSAG02_NODE_144_length_34086_cov_65.390944_29_plen_329_part_00
MHIIQKVFVIAELREMDVTMEERPPVRMEGEAAATSGCANLIGGHSQGCGEVRGVYWLKLRGQRCPSTPPTTSSWSSAAAPSPTLLSPQTTAPTQHKCMPCRSRSPRLATLRQPIAASERARCREGQERAAGWLKLESTQMREKGEGGQGEGALEGVDGHHAAFTPQCRTMVCVRAERTGQSALRVGRHAGAAVGRRARARGERGRRRRSWRCSRVPGTLSFDAGHVLHLPPHSPTPPDEVWRRYGVPCPLLPCEREGRPSIISSWKPCSSTRREAAAALPEAWNLTWELTLNRNRGDFRAVQRSGIGLQSRLRNHAVLNSSTLAGPN